MIRSLRIDGEGAAEEIFCVGHLGGEISPYS